MCLISAPNSGAIHAMTTDVKILRKMRDDPAGVRFADLLPWAGDPRINIQNDGGKARAYQVKQALLAIDRLEKGGGHHD